MRCRLYAFWVLVALLGLSSTARAQSISGVLTDASTGQPLGNPPGTSAYGLAILNTEGNTVGTLSTAPDGTYQTPALLPGIYYVWAFDMSGGYVSELHGDLPCFADDCVFTAGTPVVANLTPVVVNFALSRAGKFTGTVRRASGGTPVGGVTIEVYNAAGSLVAVPGGAAITTANDGTYLVNGLSDGVYYARTQSNQVGQLGGLNLLDELYGGLPCAKLALDLDCRVVEGTPIVVTGGATTSGIDFSLDTAGGIEGRVTDGTGQPLSGVRVAAYIGDRIVGIDSTSSGFYRVGNLPPGTYSVQARYLDGDVIPEWYDDKCVACGGRPTPVVVTAGGTTQNIDFALAAGGAIEGNISYTQPIGGVAIGPPSVYVYNASGVLVETRTFPIDTTGQFFRYRVGGLAPGIYYVRTGGDAVATNVLQSPPRITPALGRLVGELFDNIVCVAADCRPTSGRPITVATGQVTSGIDFALDVGGTISGFGIFPFGAPINVYDSRGVLVPGRHEINGSTLVGLPAGSYYLRQPRFNLSSEQKYDLIDDCPECPPTSGTPVVVALGQDRPNVNFAQLPGRAIRGTIRDASTAQPLSNITVEAYAADGRLIGSERSSFGGVYRIGRLGPGTYFLRTVNTRNYVDEVYDNVVCPGCSPTMGLAVVVTRAADTTGIDFSLASGAPIGGVVQASDGLRLSGAGISIFDAAGSLKGRSTSGTFGRFAVTLPAGSYRARSDATAGYQQELFNDIPCPQGSCDVATGTPIALAGSPVMSINFALNPCAAAILSPLSLATGAVGTAYRQTFGAAGGVSPRRFHVVSGALPPGVTLDAATGVLSGTPTAAGSFAVTIGVTDASGCSGTRAYVLAVLPCGFVLDSNSASLRARGEPWLVRITGACGQWSVRTDASWLTMTLFNPPPRLLLVAAPNPGPGPRSASVLIGPRVFTVSQSAPVPTPPIGFVDTPADGAHVDGSIAIGGWALDDLGVTEVRIYRNAVAPEPAGARVFVGNAVFVENARPDIERVYPSYPNARRAGWGFMVLTNMLPQQGNGTFEISAYAVDADLTESLLGRRTIVVNNAVATAPFGAIDTPRQGETISGASYVNFGWALTPHPKAIPTDGSTFLVYVDGVPLGPVTYNSFRSDIATLFPGYANSGGAVGFRVLDTTTLDEGLHTIGWTVADNLGAAAGIGSRYFTVSNSAPGTPASFAAGVSAGIRAQVGRVPQVPARVDGVDIGRYVASLDHLPLGDAGARVVALGPLDRVELALEREPIRACAATWSGYHVVDGQTRTLPSGSALDPIGTFFWQPGPAFGGTYDLVFVRTACDGQQERIPLQVTIAPR